jgi:hypothetical protein
MSVSSPASFPSAAVSASASSSPRLDRDALGSVLSFLSLRELAAALSVHKDWIVAVQSMRSAMLTSNISNKELDTLLLLSSPPPLLRHVGQLGQRTDRGSYNLSLRARQVSALVHAFPQLHSLAFCLELPPAPEPLLLNFPLGLQRLSLSVVNSSNALKARATVLLTSIGQLSQLVSLRLELRHEQLMSLAPLQQLPLLRNLDLQASSFPHMESRAAELRALPWLHRLHVEPLVFSYFQEAPHVPLFTVLLRDAPEEELRALQWRDCDFDRVPFNDELAPLLLRLPMLERLKGNFLECTHFDWLAALPRLTHLELQLWSLPKLAWQNLLAVFTSNGLTRMHALDLHGGSCTVDDLAQILSHTPSLTTLGLVDLREVTSLSFFRELPKLAETLTQLTVKCHNVCAWTAADLQPLLVLQQLRELRLYEWPKALTAVDSAPFEQRPCIVLPQLEVFEWTVEEPLRL